jgi:hypothetical protein
MAHLERVENRVNVGTPDVNYALLAGRGEGWIELKHLDAWPARAETIVRLDHVTTQQRNWWRERARAGGNVFVMLRVGHTYAVFRGEVAADVLGTSTAAELQSRASLWHTGEFPTAQLFTLLQGRTR